MSITATINSSQRRSAIIVASCTSLRYSVSLFISDELQWCVFEIYGVLIRFDEFQARRKLFLTDNSKFILEFLWMKFVQMDKILFFNNTTFADYAI